METSTTQGAISHRIHQGDQFRPGDLTQSSHRNGVFERWKNGGTPIGLVNVW